MKREEVRVLEGEGGKEPAREIRNEKSGEGESNGEALEEHQVALRPCAPPCSP